MQVAKGFHEGMDCDMGAVKMGRMEELESSYTVLIMAEGEYGAQGISPCRINATQTYSSVDR